MATENSSIASLFLATEIVFRRKERQTSHALLHACVCMEGRGGGNSFILLSFFLSLLLCGFSFLCSPFCYIQLTPCCTSSHVCVHACVRGRNFLLLPLQLPLMYARACTHIGRRRRFPFPLRSSHFLASLLLHTYARKGEEEILISFFLPFSLACCHPFLIPSFSLFILSLSSLLPSPTNTVSFPLFRLSSPRHLSPHRLFYFLSPLSCVGCSLSSPPLFLPLSHA